MNFKNFELTIKKCPISLFKIKFLNHHINNNYIQSSHGNMQELNYKFILKRKKYVKVDILNFFSIFFVIIIII